MGAVLSCCEPNWDGHRRVRHAYKPAPEPGGPPDMGRPLPAYFIAASASSYLTPGVQLTGAQTAAGVEAALRGGARALGLDVYNGSGGGEPVVMRGGALKTALSFHSCIAAVAASAFVASPWPVILVLEAHAGHEAQVTMAAQLRSVLGERLFVPEPAQLAAGEFLSPAALRGKVVVAMKLKPDTPPELERLVYIRGGPLAAYDLAAGPATPQLHSLPTSKLPRPPEYYGPAPTSTATAAAAKAKGAAAGASSLVAGLAAKVKKVREPKKADIDAATAAQLEAESDDTLPAGAGAASGGAALSTSLAAPHLAQALQYNAKNLLRVYPSASSIVSSSNLSPMASWAVGASMAALNWHCWDEACWASEALFARHGNTGYQLKPEWMLRPTPAGLPQRAPRRLVVTVYSAFKHQGRRIGTFKDDPFVEVRVEGLPCDEATAASAHADNVDKLIVERSFEFKVSFPELAVLLVVLRDHDTVGSGTPLGYAAMPLATLQPGEYKLALSEPVTPGFREKKKPRMWLRVKIELGGAAA